MNDQQIDKYYVAYIQH